MTDSFDVNDEGNPAPITLDLTDDNAYYGITQALTDFAKAARGRAEDMAGYEIPDAKGSLAAFDLADLAEGLRLQIETQIDARSTPKDSGASGGVTG